jgi:hypothetical protein
MNVYSFITLFLLSTKKSWCYCQSINIFKKKNTIEQPKIPSYITCNSYVKENSTYSSKENKD